MRPQKETAEDRQLVFELVSMELDEAVLTKTQRLFFVGENRIDGIQINSDCSSPYIRSVVLF